MIETLMKTDGKSYCLYIKTKSFADFKKEKDNKRIHSAYYWSK